jgi:hypothetical protein
LKPAVIMPHDPQERRRTSALVWVVGASACCAAFVAIKYSGGGLADHLIVYLQVFFVCAAIGSAIWAGVRALGWLMHLPTQVHRHYLNQQAVRRRRLGLCLRCGYDLRAATDRCSECGMPVDRSITEIWK